MDPDPISPIRKRNEAAGGNSNVHTAVVPSSSAPLYRYDPSVQVDELTTVDSKL